MALFTVSVLPIFLYMLYPTLTYYFLAYFKVYDVHSGKLASKLKGHVSFFNKHYLP